MQASERRVIRRVSKVAHRVERLFDAEQVVGTKLPLLFNLGDGLAQPYGQGILVVIELVRIKPKEVEKQGGEGFVIAFPKAPQRVQIVGELAWRPIGFY